MFDVIRNKFGERIDYSFSEGVSEGRDIVVIGHGVTGNKDRPWAVTLADMLQEAGIAALRISFSGNGDSDGDFRESTVTKEVEDLTSVIDALAGWRVGYAGHSMGGAVGVLAAARDARIEFLISLAGMVHTHEFALRKFGDVTPDEGCMWDKPECPLSRIYMDDMKQVRSVVELGSKIVVPWLLVHGTADTVVPLSDSHDILELAGDNASLVELDGVDHVFTDAEATMAEHVIAWLRPRLRDHSQ